MIKKIKAKTFRISIPEVKSLVPVSRPVLLSPMGRITGKGDGPSCSREQVRNYEENWEKILPPKVIRQIKRKGGVLHGSWSVNQQVDKKFQRKAHDIDIWSDKPKDRAEEMENEIDKCVGCDIMQVREQVIPKGVSSVQTLGPSNKKHEKKQMRYNVETPHLTGSADYSNYRDNDARTKTILIGGVKHEPLNLAYVRVHKSKNATPQRITKAYKDIRRIEAYLKSQGKEIPKIQKRRLFG